MHDDFPVSIDLEITPPDMSKMAEMVSGKKPGKPIYPSLYISGVSGLEDLPREGYALIHFKRRSVTMGERDGEDCCSAELEVHEIRLPEKGSEEEMGDMADAMKSLAKEKGFNVGSTSDDEEEEGESPEEEAGEDEEAESLAEEMPKDEDEDEEE